MGLGLGTLFLIGAVVVSFAGLAVYLAPTAYKLTRTRVHFGDGTPFIGIIRPEYQQILAGNFPYYQRLSAQHKKRFEARVQAFIDYKQFIPRNLPAVTAEMKVLIAATAVQITYGLPHIVLQHFSKILIYPDDYYSSINETYHRGEVNPRFGIIVLSWRSFIEGYLNPNDGINLGLHEMAHALHFENAIFNGEANFLEQEVLTLWNQLAQTEINDMIEGRSKFFRAYAASNVWEFFAVAKETFFERTQVMKQAKPELFYCLIRLLKQDPLEIQR